MANTRTLAVKALLRVNEGGFSNIVLDALLSGAQLEHRDKAFVSALFYGVLERRITLDRILKKYSKTPLEELEPAVLECLRIGFYQLIYMNSVPDMAAANETVEAVKQLGCGKASGFVNVWRIHTLGERRRRKRKSRTGWLQIGKSYSI